MTTQTLELQAVTDEELQAVNGGIAPIFMAIVQAAGPAVARAGVSVGAHALTEHLKEEHKAA